MATYSFTVEGLKLPTVNKALRMNYFERNKEAKATREAVRVAALQAGYNNPPPLLRAKVSIRAFGSYQRRDSDGTLPKYVIDALVARKIRKYGQQLGREYGFLMDDNRATIGEVDFKVVMAESYKVEIVIQELRDSPTELKP